MKPTNKTSKYTKPATTEKSIEESRANQIHIFPNYYVVLTNPTTGEVKEIHQYKGNFHSDNPWHVIAIETVMKDFTRLLSRPTLANGTKLYEHEETSTDTEGWE